MPTWTGTISTDWATAGNWSGFGTPSFPWSVSIGTTANSPTIASNSSIYVDVLSINGLDTLTLGDASGGNGQFLQAADWIFIGGGGGILGQGHVEAGIKGVSISTSGGPATITVKAVNGQSTPQLEVFGTINDGADALTLVISNDANLNPDELILDANSSAHALNFSGGTGHLVLQQGLNVNSQMAIGKGTVVLAGAIPTVAVLTDKFGATISTGTITGQGVFAASLTATGAANITTGPGSLEINGNIADNGSALTITIANSGDKLLLDGVSTAQTVTMAAGTTLELNTNGSLNYGNVLAIGNSTVKLDGANATLTDSSGVTLTSGAIIGTGKISGPITGGSTATVTASGGTLDLQTLIAAAAGPNFQIANGASNILQIDSTVGTGNNFTFLGTTGELRLGNPGGFHGTILGLAPGDTIDLPNIAFNPAGTATVAAGNVLQISEGGNNFAFQLDPAQHFADDEFYLASDGGAGTLILPVVDSYDFRGNGSANVLLQNNPSVNGQIVYANMLGGVFQSWTIVANTPNWSVVGAGHVAGNPSSDVVIQNPSTGQIAYANLVNGNFSNWVGVAITPGWNVVGVGDINDLHFADIVVQNHSTGQIAYANMNGGVLQNWVGVANTPGFNVVGVGDVNGDGFADIVVQNPTSGEIDYANMNGGVFTSWARVAITPGWNAVGVGDINRDGFADVVIQNQSTSQIAYANMAGGAFTSWVGVATTPGFNVTAVEDIIGTGYGDIVVQNPNTGEIDYANMTGGTFQGWGAVAVEPGWTAHTGPADTGGSSALFMAAADTLLLPQHPGALE